MAPVQGLSAPLAVSPTLASDKAGTQGLPAGPQSLQAKYRDAGPLSLLSLPAAEFGAATTRRDDERVWPEADSRASGGLAAAGSGGEPPPPNGNGLQGHYADAPDPGQPDAPDPGQPTHTGFTLPRHVDPAWRSDFSGETRQLAMVQTTAARDLLYHPGALFRQELGLAAANLVLMMTDLLTPHDANLLEALGGRLLGQEGLLANRQPQDLLDAVLRVAQDVPPAQSRASGHDRAVVLALMGDVGALYADTGATTGVANRSPDQAAMLRLLLSDSAEQLGLSRFETATEAVKNTGGSNAVGPAKREERIRPSDELPARTGIHSVGPEADDLLGIAQHERIPMARWQVAHIELRRVVGTEEPLVGHMSGSPAEILHVWDLLRGEPPEGQFIGMLQARGEGQAHPMAALDAGERDGRYARAAGAAAFLVGLGYHSAVEVVEDTLLYTGQTVRDHLDHDRQDAGHLLGQGAATDLITELMQAQRRTGP